ncbi:MAG: NADH:flavin oxidoreductase [Promethearchaeota archaeon]
MELKKLFSPYKIGNVHIKNRIVRSATSENMANDMLPSKQMIDFYTELARGGTGLIITGGIAVDPSSTLTKKAPGLFEEAHISGHKKLVTAVHDYTDVKIAAQIVHTGRLSGNRRYESVAPSSIPSLRGRVPRELTTDEITTKIVKLFVECGLRAYESEYDMVQLHAAHGYLLGSFLAPFTNKRRDEYGGTVSNRTRILVNIYERLRDEVGSNFPITIKLQTQDGDLPDGLTIEEGIEMAKIVADTGFDAIEPSGGGEDLFASGTDKTLPSVEVKSPEDENYFLPTVRKIKAMTEDCAIILMGGIKNPLSAESILRENNADFISMSRPLINEPDLPNRWMGGDHSPARCISCNKCYMTIINDSLECYRKRKKETKE